MHIENINNSSPYNSFAKYLRSRGTGSSGLYSSEIDGIMDENGDRSIDAPDNANSEKEWEYFCLHAGQFPKTVKMLDSSIPGFYSLEGADPDALLGLIRYLISLFRSCPDLDPETKELYACILGNRIGTFANRADISGEKKDELLLALMPSLGLDEFAAAMPQLNFTLPSLYMHKTVTRSVRDEFIVKLAFATGPGKRGQVRSARMAGFFFKNTLQVNYINGLSVEIDDLDNVWKINDLLLSMIIKLPPGFFKGLKDLSVESTNINRYIPWLRKVCLNPLDLSSEMTVDYQNTITHELAHHWSMHSDLSYIYYAISWNIDRDHWIGNWNLREDDPHDFTQGGMSDPLEDIATFTASYVNIPVELRKYVREQIDAGNFEPAAKYLFTRFLMPFKGLEYETNDLSPILGFEEVRSKLAAYLFDHPSRVAKTTIDAIDRIEKEYNTNTENL